MRSIKPIFKVLLIISIIMYSCINERIETAVIIESSSDTIKIDSTYSAELYLKHNNKLHPADYYILFMHDTFLLDYDHLKKCANFNAQPNSPGEKDLSRLCYV
jgi:hypothetical protein